MIPFKIRSTTLIAYVFSGKDGTTVYADSDTLRRWKRAIDAWTQVQGEMGAAEKAAQPHEPINYPPPNQDAPPQFVGLPTQIELPPQPPEPVLDNTGVSVTPKQIPNANGELVAFDSRSYRGSGIQNGIPIPQPAPQNEQPKPVELSVSEPPSRPTTKLRRAYHKRKARRPRQKVESAPPEQEPDQTQVAVT